MNHPAKLEQKIKSASDAFAMMLETHFIAWNLTNEEGAIARLGLQGYDVHDCADILQIRPETAKLHQNNAFSKISISRWSDLMGFLIDQLYSGAKRKTPCPFVWN